MRHYFLGLAANYKGRCWEHIFTVGRERDREALTEYLGARYGGKAILTKNGRSALALALKAYFDRNDKVIVNGFTCYAVYEAVKAAGLTPVFADISQETLNFDAKIIENILKKDKVAGIIIQNTLGNPVDIETIKKIAKKYNLMIIEDLAHSVGVKYPNGQEVGTVGAATVLSFGKEKSIDTVSGGAVILREPCKNSIKAPSLMPKISDNLRARFYPLIGATCRGLSYFHLGGLLMRCLVKIHWVEKSADNKLDLERKLAKFEARLALAQLKALRRSSVLREFYLVEDRDMTLKELKRSGYYFDGVWYEKPVSPERYYKKVHFPEADCPNAVYVAEHIVNLPVYYSKADLTPAREIIKRSLVKIPSKEAEE